MRDILFRGKANALWIYGDLYHLNDGRVTIRKDGELYPYEVIPETVGQYTGLRDKTASEYLNKRIFEGDIFECYVDYDDSWGYTQTSSFLAVVVWDEKHFCWGMKVNDEIQDFSDWTWENSFLVGNIHDNPELLKGE